MKKCFVTLLVCSLCAIAFGGSFLRKTEPIIETDEAPMEVKSAPLWRKTMVIIGDSYVQNHHRPIEETWHYRLAAKYQMKYFNYGRNGNTLVIQKDKNWGAPMIRRYGEMHTPADCVVVIAGHNDACKMDVADAADIATFRDGVTNFVAKLKAKYNDAKIVFVSPWNVDKEGFKVVLGAYRELLPSLGVHFYDAAILAPFDPNDPETRKKYFQGPKDTAHLNATGHAKMLETIEPFFLGVK